jgi:hypothetical protein
MTGDRLYQCGGSGMFIQDPDFTHLGSRIQKPQWKEVTLSIQLLDPA